MAINILWAEYEQWAKAVDNIDNYRTLLDWAEASRRSAEVPCVCLNADCLRCRMERVLAEEKRTPQLVEVEGAPPW